jgi:histidinol-phosphate/aromatic aminotransferase/cobyric acid decarboxylase-like protein
MIPLRPNIRDMAGYVPGYQPPDIASWIKLNTNENPYPPSPKVREAILAELGSDGACLRTYPSASSALLRQAAGELYGFDPSWIIMANGSDEVLNNLIRAFAAEGEEIAFVHPSYSYYATLAEIQGGPGTHLRPDQRLPDQRLPATLYRQAVVPDLTQRAAGLCLPAGLHRAVGHPLRRRAGSG